MNIVLGLTIYICILWSVLNDWLFLMGALVTWFSFRYSPATLIPLALLVDGYFGQFESWPWLSTGAVVWFVLVDLVKPRIIQRDAT